MFPTLNLRKNLMIFKWVSICKSIFKRSFSYSSINVKWLKKLFLLNNPHGGFWKSHLLINIFTFGNVFKYLTYFSEKEAKYFSAGHSQQNSFKIEQVDIEVPKGDAINDINIILDEEANDIYLKVSS